MKKRTKRINGKKRTTISLASDLLHKGEQRAREVRRNFSNYVEVLIEADLGTATGEIKMPAQVPGMEMPV